MRLVFLLLLGGLSVEAAPGWSRGNYSTLSFSTNGYDLTVGGSIKLHGALPSGTSFATSSGNDPALGPYDQLSLVSNAKTIGFVRYLSAADAFLLSRQDPALPFPAFELYRNDSLKTVSWGQGAGMVGGYTGLAPRQWAQKHGHFAGPVFLSDSTQSQSPQQSPPAAIGLSAVNHFDANGFFVDPSRGKSSCSPEDAVCLLAGRAFNASIVPSSISLDVLLLGRPGLTRATRAVGALLRRSHRSTRLRGPSVNSLSYWSDNAAGYSWWSMPNNDLDVYGPIGELYLRLLQEYKREGILFGAWQSDNTFGRIPAIGADGKSAGGWCFSDWTRWNLTQYPGGGSVHEGSGGWPAKMRAVQNSSIQQPMTFSYYIYFHCHDNVWRNGVPAFGSTVPGSNKSKWAPNFLDVGPWRAGSKPLNYGKGDQSVTLLHPDSSYDFYLELMRHARDEWGMEMLFKDDLSDQGSRITKMFPQTFGAKDKWLGGLAKALEALGMSMQCCMTAPEEIMASLDWPAVTNARVSGDGGRSLNRATLGAVLTAMVGVGWSKDNVRISGEGLRDSGAVKGDSSWGFKELQLRTALLSLGPVGLADPLTAHPSDPAARISTNVTLAKTAVALNGTLLQPSYPLTPIADVLLNLAPLGVEANHVWATFTAVPAAVSGRGSGSGGGSSSSSGSGGSGSAVWFTALGWGAEFGVGSERSSSSSSFSSPTCNYTSHADKTSGHMYQHLMNTTREQCCDACWADNATCDAYVRATDSSGVGQAGECFLITDCDQPGKTKRSGNREVGFTRYGPRPTPVVADFMLVPSVHLLPMVDFSAGAEPSLPFDQPPQGAFVGSGVGMGMGTGTGSGTRYAYWRQPTAAAAAAAAAAQPPATADGALPCAQLLDAGLSASVNVSLSSDASDQLNFAPVLPGATAVLLGEADKIAAVSTFRFRSVAVDPTTGGLEVRLAGVPGETVTLLWASLLGAQARPQAAGELLGLSVCKQLQVAFGAGQTGATVRVGS
jgi:hypothetical protein